MGRASRRRPRRAAVTVAARDLRAGMFITGHGLLVTQPTYAGRPGTSFAGADGHGIVRLHLLNRDKPLLVSAEQRFAVHAEPQPQP